MSIVHIQNINHSFGDKQILRDVSVRLLQHEHVGLVGVNGAGKSTLMSILTGEIIPDSGNIEWLPNTQVGHLEQHMDLTSGLTIRDFLRGAFQRLFDIEHQMSRLADKMGQIQDNEELQKILERYAVFQATLEEENFYAVDAKIDTVCSGLGLLILGLDTELQQLSGGQRTKVLLAKLLLQEPTVLLLDEPTNYLDTEHIHWLSEFLKGYPNAFVVISHDTQFLDKIVSVVYHLEHQALTRYAGNYSQFLAAYSLRGQQQALAYVRQQEEIKKLETYIHKNKARASTAKQAKSREKRLAKMERIDKPVVSPKPRFAFSVNVDPTSRVVSTRELIVGYDTPLLSPLSLTIKRGDKVALVGFNGVGKSTLIKTIVGEVRPLGGTVTFGERVQPLYFAQEVFFSGNHSALEEIWNAFPGLTQKEIRKHLALCGLRAEHIMEPVSSLSGGEQTKVRLCKLMLLDGNWLILDEPTNHLDASAKASLREALIRFPGTVLVVTHEPDFYQDWITHVWNVNHENPVVQLRR